MNMADRLYMNEMRFQLHVGATETERMTKQTISITVGLEAELRNAGAADDLSRTINYADLYKEIQARVEGKEFNLIDAVMVRVVKQLPKPRYSLRDVTVEIYRKRGE